MRCKYCNTEVEIAEGLHSVMERTADMPPPAHAVIWALPERQQRPDFLTDPVHECRHGVAV